MYIHTHTCMYILISVFTYIYHASSRIVLLLSKNSNLTNVILKKPMTKLTLEFVSFSLLQTPFLFQITGLYSHFQRQHAQYLNMTEARGFHESHIINYCKFEFTNNIFAYCIFIDNYCPPQLYQCLKRQTLSPPKQEFPQMTQMPSNKINTRPACCLNNHVLHSHSHNRDSHMVSNCTCQLS